MALERVNSAFDITSIEGEQKRLLSLLKESQDAISNFSKQGINIEMKLGNVKNISDLNKLMSELETVSKETAQALNQQAQAQKNLADATLKEQKAATEEIKTKRENLKLLEETERARVREEKRIGQLTGEYSRLSKELTNLRNKTKDYIIANGENHPIAMQMIADTQALDQRLKAVDATVGQYQRSVGNYNMVGAQFNQLAREMTNIGISLRTTVLALSNNMGYFAESIIAARKQGQSWKEVIASMTSGTNLLILGINLAVAAFTYLATHLDIFTDEADKAEKSASKLTKEVERLKKEVEELFTGGASFDDTKLSSINKTIEADERRLKIAKANGEASKKILEDENAIIDRKIAKLEAEIKSYNDRTTSIIRFDKEVYKNMQGIEDLKAQKILNTANFEKEQAEKTKKEAEKRAKEAEQRIKKELDAQTKILVSKVNKEAIIEKSIIEDEASGFAARREARRRLADEQIQIINIERNKELANTELTASQKLAINLDANNKILQVRLELQKDLGDLNEKELAEFKQKEKDRVKAATDADKEIHDKRVAYFNARKAEYDEELAENKQIAASIHQIATAILSLGQIRKNISDNNLKNIDEEIRKNQEGYQYQVDLIRESTIDAEEKERRIQEAQAETQSKDLALREQARQERRRQAEFDKAMAITQIIINTAAAVVQALLDPKAPLIKAAAVGAAGAAQLAIAAATPIPAFAAGDPEGTKTGGLALIGEAGSELVVDGNKAYMVNKPTIKDLAPRTKIFNQEQMNELFAGLNGATLRKVLTHTERNPMQTKEITDAIKQVGDKTIKAIQQNRAIQNVNVNNQYDPYYNRMVKGRA